MTTDNPFLPEQYIEQLRSELDPKMARRMIYGEWLEIEREVVYHAYSRERNYRAESYRVDATQPIHISWDFNIGDGKPLSAVLFQFIDDRMHIFAEVVVDGMRTQDSLDELDARGWLDGRTSYIIHGDAAGRHRDTRNIKSDYDIIRSYFANHRRGLRFDVDVPLSNGAVRTRHNTVNAYCHNDKGETRLFVYQDAPTADEGLRLTQLKKGGQYIEDDSKRWQHITTAIGYGLIAARNRRERKPQRTIQL